MSLLLSTRAITDITFPSSPSSSSTTKALLSLTPKTLTISSSVRKSRRIDSFRLHVTAAPSTSNQTVQEQESYQVGIEGEDEKFDSKFSWRDHWYPVSLIEDLDPTIPTPFQLLNRDIVLWKDRVTGDWVAFDDKCPHRLAPLSEGRIDEDGNLQCSYHGWSFNGCGSCTRIPQASSEGPEARAIKSPRACATRFPTMVSQGLLFVWPDENGQERAQATRPPM